MFLFEEMYLLSSKKKKEKTYKFPNSSTYITTYLKKNKKQIIK